MNKQILDYIVSDIKTQCARLGVDADFKMCEGKDYRGDKYDYLESSPFRQYPMMFKKAFVRGVFHYNKVDGQHTEVGVSLDWRWESFSGGSNGTELGWLHYDVINPDNDAPIGEDEMRYYVTKKKGIML